MKSITTFFKKLTIGKKILLLLTPLITLFLNMKIAILALFFLIFLDLLTGIRKTRTQKKIKLNLFKLEYWKNIKSYLLRQTWKKTYEYIFGIVAISIVEVYLLDNMEVKIAGKINTITKWTVIVASIIELWSIFENMESVSGRNPLKKLVNLLPDNIKKLFNKKDNNE